LRAALKAKNLPVTGKKEDLISRLISAADTSEESIALAVEAVPEAPVHASVDESAAAAAIETSTEVDPPSKHNKITFNEKSTEVFLQIDV
jgi:hypothetical protein